MIPLAIEHLFSVYIYLWFFAVAILWFKEISRMRKGDWSIAKEKLYKCDNCHLSFLSHDDSENVTRCPRCNEMCFIRKRKRF